MGSGASTGAVIGGVIGAGLAPFTGGLSLGLLAATGAGIGAAAGYANNKIGQMNRAGAAEANKMSDITSQVPTPPPAAKPATLAQAAGASLKAKSSSSAPVKARASGTIGAEGPQGLQAPPQTANLTLLGGTR